MTRSRRLLRLATAGGLAALVVLATGSPAGAEPATTVSYPAWSSATRYVGLAFDACAAPPLSSIQAWNASPYRAIAVYMGGVNRTCLQPQLTKSWVTAVTGLRWSLLPVYKGLQPPCGGKATDQKIVPARAASQGTAAADDAAARGKALGMLRGSAFYNDIENYATTNATCRTAVLTYLSAWTRELHRLGYISGVYVNLSSGAPDLSRVYTSTAYARPDALWIARYDGNSSLAGWAGISDQQWAAHQRAKQYRGGHDETYGGVTINIDNDNVDAPVATVSYRYTATGKNPVKARTGPGTSYPYLKTYLPGSTLPVICQTHGSLFGTTSVWDRLTDGTFVTDYRVSTPSKTTYSAPVTRCMYPYQVTAANGLTEHTGPSASSPAAGLLRGGALGWVTCQQAGTRVGTTAVWDKLRDGHWVSDYYLATPSKTTYAAPVPRC
ncbi:MAG TPA: glycoside hydrolase domain-containing protein [Streptosporangiaceae bacterium]|nr:glycoside hydrolase domain-containing protein [Streptosporangiaceae bacterium]